MDIVAAPVRAVWAAISSAILAYPAVAGVVLALIVVALLLPARAAR